MSIKTFFGRRLSLLLPYFLLFLALQMLVRFSLLLLSFPATALADDAAAQRHFEAGQVAFVKRHYEEAANEFEAAHAESPHPAALFNAGVAWSQAGKAAIFGQLEQMGLSHAEHFVHFLEPVSVSGVTAQVVLS